MNNQTTLEIDEYGIKSWKLNGEYHRVDGPAIIYPDGSEYWFLNGFLHRVNGPAVVNSNGYKVWYLNGKYHRDDGPAYMETGGNKIWYLSGIPYIQEEWFKKLTPEQQNHYLWNLNDDF
jgi:hypothetical protein